MLQNGQYYLLTHWGTLLDYDPDTNKACLQSTFDRSPRLTITIIGDKTRLQYLSKNNFWLPLYVDTDGRLKADPQHALETRRKNPVDAHFTHAPPSSRQFTMNGLFLSAGSNGEIRSRRHRGVVGKPSASFLKTTSPPSASFMKTNGTLSQSKK